MKKRLLTPAEFAEMVQEYDKSFTPLDARDMAIANKIPFIDRGNRSRHFYRFKKSDVQEFIAREYGSKPAPAKKENNQRPAVDLSREEIRRIYARRNVNTPSHSLRVSQNGYLILYRRGRACKCPFAKVAAGEAVVCCGDWCPLFSIFFSNDKYQVWIACGSVSGKGNTCVFTLT